MEGDRRKCRRHYDIPRAAVVSQRPTWGPFCGIWPKHKEVVAHVDEIHDAWEWRYDNDHCDDRGNGKSVEESRVTIPPDKHAQDFSNNEGKERENRLHDVGESVIFILDYNRTLIKSEELY